nr:uncharacterized protein LOC113720385 [Coffea arabica]
MIPITSSWPFEQWGTDIIGPFPRVPGNYAYVVVAVGYFTKWIEAEPLRSIIGAAVQKFFWKSVVCRFALPRVVISDNGGSSRIILSMHGVKTWGLSSISHRLDTLRQMDKLKTLTELSFIASRPGSTGLDRHGWKSSPACCGPTGLRRDQQPKRPRFP